MKRLLLFWGVIILQGTAIFANEGGNDIRLKIDSILFLFDKKTIEIKVSLYNGTSDKIFVSDSFKPLIVNFTDRKQDMMPNAIEEYSMNFSPGHEPSKLALKEIKPQGSCFYTLDLDMPDMNQDRKTYLLIKVSYSISDVNFLYKDNLKHKQKEVFIGDILSLKDAD